MSTVRRRPVAGEPEVVDAEIVDVIADDGAFVIDAIEVGDAVPTGRMRSRSRLRRTFAVTSIVAAAVAIGAGAGAFHRGRVDAHALATKERLLDFFEALLHADGAGVFRHTSVASAGGDLAQRLEAANARLAEVFEGDSRAERRARRVLGNAYRGLGLGDEARRELTRAVEIARTTDGAESRAHAVTLADLAAFEATNGDVRVAEKQLREALAILDVDFPEDEARWLATAELGWVRKHRNDLDDAERLLKAALVGLRKHQGVDHPAIPGILGELGVLEDDRGDLTSASSYYQQAIDALSIFPAAMPSERTWALVKLAELELVKRGVDVAEPLLDQAFAQLRHAGADDDVDGIPAHLLASRIALTLAQHERAESSARTAFEVAERLLPPEHPDRVLAQAALAEALLALGRAHEAEPMTRAALDAARRAGDGSWRTAALVGVLADCVFEQGRVDEAEAFAVASLRDIEASQGLRNPRTRSALARLAGIYERTNRHAAAAELLARLEAPSTAGVP